MIIKNGILLEVNPIEAIGYFVVPDGVTEIGHYVLAYYDGLKGVTIPDSVKSIGSSAFYDSTDLKSKVANYKAFKITPYGELKCRDKTYKEGHKSSVRGELKLCENGIHYCTNLFEVFNYYYGELDKDIAIYKCDVSDENVCDVYSSKRCARWLVPRKRLHREDVIRILNGGE